jgi:peptide/nickel transport system substrate-binding protein
MPEHLPEARGVGVVLVRLDIDTLHSRTVTLAGRSRRAVAALALAALIAAGVAACGAGRHTTTTTAPPSTSPRTFVDVVGELPGNLDDTATPDAASTELLPNWSGELVRPASAAPGPDAVLPADGAVVPYLATSWTVQAGGDAIFELRRHVFGPTGDPFTAADVRWSLERAIARSPVAPFLLRLAHVNLADPVTVLSAHSVRINVTAPSPFLLSVLASADAAIYDRKVYLAHASPSDPWAQVWGADNSASYCAYYVASFIPGSELVLAANPGFWGHPYFTSVIIRQVSDPGDRVHDVLTGQATHTTDLDWGDFAVASNQGPATGVTATILQNGPGVLAWHLNVTHGPLANPLVRQAINIGIDRSELVNDLGDGLAAPAVLTIPATFGATQPNISDPVQARSLMRAAGYPHAITIDVATNDSVAGTQIYNLLATLRAQLVQIDILLHTVVVDNTDQLLALEVHHRVESSMETISPLLGGAAFLVEQDANSTVDPVSTAAQEGYRNPALQTVLDQLDTTPAGTAATALAQQAATMLDTALPTINLAYVPVQNVTRADVTGYRAYTQPVVYYEHLHPVG